ncbi:MAG TPA: Ig-like domain-containing protein [Steroidobacteraceae bacterium]
MRIANSLAFLLAVVAFNAFTGCGGGSNGCSNFATCSTGSSGGGGNGVATITLTTSVATIPTDGSALATITATALNANRNAVTGVTVTFSASAGSVVVTSGTTDASGVATATLSGSGVASGTNITVTAASGGIDGTIPVQVINAQQTISLTTSVPQMPSNGSAPATITALVRGASNQLLPGVSVNFSATSGGLSGTNPAVTGANGAATILLVTAGDPTDRVITVTATAGSSTAQIAVSVIGTTLNLAGPNTLISGNQGTYTVALTDSGGAGIGNKAVAITDSAGNMLSAASLTTDAAGNASFTMTAGAAANDTLTATSLGLTAQEAVTISNQLFSFTTPATGTNIPISTSQAVTVNWTAGGVAQVGKTVTFSTTRGIFGGVAGEVSTTAVTDATGTATVNISSTSAGPAVITASGTGVTAQDNVNFVATAPTMLVLQASPDTVPTEGESTVSATLTDANGNLVANQTIDFQLQDVTGGSLSVGTAVTNSQGQAQTVYTASGTASAKNGVTITGTVPAFPAPAVPAAQVSLTVGGQTVFLSLGTGAFISENTAKTQFIMPWVVTAVDSAGNPVDGVNVTLVISTVSYGKGGWIAGTSQWEQTGTPNAVPPTITGITVCPALTNPVYPGNIAAVAPSTVTTSAVSEPGSAALNVLYPEDYADWVYVSLTATATVTGTQSSSSTSFWLPILASYVNTITSAIPGQTSPFGVGPCP